MPQQSVRRDVLTALQEMFVRQMSVRRDVLTDLQQMFACHDVLASQQQMLITALQQLTFIPTMQQQMITTLDVHHAAVDVRHDLAAAVDDPHHHAAADDVRHDVLIVRHDVLTTLQQQEVELLGYYSGSIYQSSRTSRYCCTRGSSAADDQA